MLYMSVGLYAVSIITPSLFGNAFISVAAVIFLFTGFIDLLSQDFLLGIFWLASPLLFIAWYQYRRKPVLSLICAAGSLICCCTGLVFFIQSGFYNFTNDLEILSIYFLDLFSIAIMLVAAINQYLTQRKLALTNKSRES